MNKHQLQRGLEELGLNNSGTQVSKLERYIEEIERWNPQYGLIASDDDLVIRHVLDSLGGLDLIRRRQPSATADIGSGAGFPGIPLALWMKDTAFTLVERSGRRAGFLRNAALSLGLNNITVLEQDAERMAQAQFDLITFRAWSPVTPKRFKALKRLLMPGGCIAAYKGKRRVIDAEFSVFSDQLTDFEVRRLVIPGLKEERHLVLFC